MAATRARVLVVMVLLCSAGAMLPAQQPPAERPVVIHAGMVVDPAAGGATPSQTIVVEHGKISAIGARVTAPPDAIVIDLPRSTVLPGLFDAHTHMCLDVNPDRDAGNYFHTVIHDPDSLRAIQGAVNARTMLEAGFTTIRDVGNEGNYACTSVRVAIENGIVPGPTMLNAGRIIAPYGGQFHLQPDRPDITGAEYFFADTHDEMIKGIRENIHYGARLIKIVVDDQQYVYSPEDIKFIVDEAARAGAKVAAHVWTTQGAHNAALAGVASMEHLNGAVQADLQVAKNKGVTAVFTPFPLGELTRFRQADRAREEWDTELAQLRLGLRVGLPIAFGSDAIMEAPGLTRGRTTLEWIDSYVAAGFSPAAIVKAMTVTPARLLGVDQERGALKPGMAADIIATPANPLEHIDTLKNVSFVMKNGRVIRNGEVR